MQTSIPIATPHATIEPASRDVVCRDGVRHGRHTNAAAAPSSRPVERVIVDRYMKFVRSDPSNTPGGPPSNGESPVCSQNVNAMIATAMPTSQPAHCVGVSRLRASTHERERPEQVPLLLDGEAPQVPQRRRIAGREVRHVADDLAPVGDVEDRPRQVASQLRQLLVRAEDRRPRRHRDEHRTERRQQSAGPAVPELA